MKGCTDREEVHAHGNVQEGKEKNALSLLLVYDEEDGYEPSSLLWKKAGYIQARGLVALHRKGSICSIFVHR